MNEYESLIDEQERSRDNDLTEAAATPAAPRRESDESHAVVENRGDSGGGGTAGEADSPPDTSAETSPAESPLSTTEPDAGIGDSEASQSQCGDDASSTPPEAAHVTAERAPQDAPVSEAGQEDGTEPQMRRVVLEAGTDEESLKALALCREKVSLLRLRMHPLAARWESDRHVIIFFRADEKVDFRKLVRELSRLLHARIELRQVGPREQGKLCGLVGKCGYPLCCQTFLGQFAQSTIKMAKTQELALNPMKISGVCGRLLCCLNYEQEMYLEAKSHMPRVNRVVDTEFGPGRVVAVNVLKQTITVQLETATKELRPDQILPSESQS